MTDRRLRRALAPLSLTLLCSGAFGQDAASDEDRGASAASGFQAVRAGPVQEVSGALLVATAYGIILALFAAYVLRLARLHARASRDLAALRRKLPDV